MTEVISVRFRGGCKNYYFDPKGHAVKMGDQVIVETAQGPEFGTCTQGNHEVADEAVVQPLCAMLRLATDADRRTVDYNRKKESEAFDICEKKIADHGLEMKLVNVSASFDGSKIIFFFTADGRVDFRELVRDLAGVFRARIELRQIGVRDEAKMVGGLGICGRPFCCSQFLDGFLPVSIKMAKTQSLSLNPTKISGTCGRLMCCLKYEQDAYEDAVKRMPKNESFVETPDGVGTVSQVNLLRETVKVRLDDEPENPRCYHNCEVCVVRNGKGKRPEGYVAPPPEELAKLRKVTAPPESEEDRLSAALANLTLAKESKPAAPAPEEGAEAEKRSRRRRARSKKPAQAAKPQGEEVPPRESRGDKPRTECPPRPPKPKSERPAPVKEHAASAPAQEGGEGQESARKPRRRYRRPRGNRPKGEGGAPKAE